VSRRTGVAMVKSEERRNRHGKPLWVSIYCLLSTACTAPVEGLSSFAHRPPCWRETVEQVTVDRRVGQMRELEMGSLTLLTTVHRSPLSRSALRGGCKVLSGFGKRMLSG